MKEKIKLTLVATGLVLAFTVFVSANIGNVTSVLGDINNTASVSQFRTKTCYMHEDIQVLENEKSDLTAIQFDRQKRLDDIVFYQRGQMLTDISSTTARIKRLEATRNKSATTTAEIKTLKEEVARIKPSIATKVSMARKHLTETQKQLSTNARNLQTATRKLCKKQDIETVSFVESDFVMPNMSCYTADNIHEYRRKHARLTAFLKHSPSLIQKYMSSNKVTYDRMVKNRDIANKYQFSLLNSIRQAENNRCRSGQQGTVVTSGSGTGSGSGSGSGTGNIQTTGYCSEGGYTTQSSCENATVELCPDSSESEDGQIGGDCQTVNAGYTWRENDEPTGGATGGDVCEADTLGFLDGYKINGSIFGIWNKGNTLCGADIGECIKGSQLDGEVRTTRGNDPGTVNSNWTCAKDDATGRPECRFTESCSKIQDQSSSF
jgi:hypothetical protein